MRSTLKFASFVLLCIMICVILVPETSFSQKLNKDTKKGEFMQQILEFSGAKPHEIRVTAWQKVKSLGGVSPSKEKMQETLELVIKEFESDLLEKNWTEEKEVTSLKMTAKNDKIFIDTAIQNINKETYLVINISGKEPTLVEDIEKRIENIFKYLKEEPYITVNLVGILDKDLQVKEQEELIKKLFLKANASIVEGITAENVVSFSGYSPEIAFNLLSDNKKVNLNIATRQFSNSGTYLFIGSPILNLEY